METWTDTHGPPRKKMRKGTKSCSECRRRKIRCTFNADRPDACNECRLRGSTCIDQERGSEDPNGPLGYIQAEQRYSLRERVAHLETVVQDLVKRLDQATATQSPSSNPPTADLSPTSMESDRLGPSSNRIENAPVMQLFDNYLVSRHDDSSSNDQFIGVKDMSPKAQVVRAELLSLLPPRHDLQKIIDEGSKLWCVWQESFPGIASALDTAKEGQGSLVAPADVAKVLVCLSMSVIQAPPNFDFNRLQVPQEPQEFASRCTEAVDRLVVRDDDFAATLPGIECQMLLCKYHLNEGRLRKAWLVNRRAIEFAHLAGIHLSTRVPRPSDTLFERRLKIWCSLATTDRYISLILGLPYGVSHNYFLPQIEQRLNQTQCAAEQYMLRIGVITGRMIDRNQNSTDICLETTLQLDQELLDAWKAMPNSFSGLELSSGEKREQSHKLIPLYFMPKVLRTLLHMPFMLKYPRDARFSYCHQTAIESAREGLTLYKVLRELTHSHHCKLIDFMSFTMGMLLIVHLHGYSELSPHHSQEQDERDWELIGDIVKILRKAATVSGGSVAAESANILGAIYNSQRDKENWFMETTCQITVPYFGTITVGAGAKFLNLRNQHQKLSASMSLESKTSFFYQTSSQSYITPLSGLNVESSSHPDSLIGGAPSIEVTRQHQPPVPKEPKPSTFANLESTAFTGLFDDFEQYTWPNANIDLGLDQGWNLSWFDNSVLPAEYA